MINTNSSLKKDREFQIIYNFGKKEFGYYSLIFFKKNEENVNRFGFVASKKTGNAVCRNRLKRLFKEYFREKSFELKKGYDIICVAKRKAGENVSLIGFKDIEKDLDKVLKRAGLKVEKDSR
ncbi:MAG: ribonuclease P protein component [Fusobacteriaceae bacterium]